MHEKLKAKLFDLIESSTYQRLTKIIINECLFLKLIWAVCYLLSFSCCSFIIIQSFVDYFKYEVSINFSILSDSGFEFPSITICNANKLDYSIDRAKTEILSYLRSLNKYNESFLNDSQNIPPDLNIFDFVNSIEADTQNIPNAKLTQLLNDYGYTAESMILSCLFNGKPCYHDSFYFKNSTKRGKRFGKCYTFNSGYNSNGSKLPFVKATRPGSPYGLQLKLFVGKPDHQPFWVTNLGAIINVHNVGDSPLTIEEGVPVRPGEETNLVLKKQVVKRLPKPYSHCIDNLTSRDSLLRDSSDKKEIPVHFNNTFLVSDNYRQKICLNECTKTLAGELNASIDAVLYNECLKYCPQECELTEYKISTFMTAFPSDEYARLILRHFNENKSEINKISSIKELRKSIISLNIYFDSKELTEIKERPTNSVEVLLANLGGQLGLFLGLDVLSFVELFEFIFVAYFLSLRKGSTNNKLNSQN